MAKPLYCRLESRALIAIEGEDARAFLQGIISNDVDKVSPERAIYAAFLTPQGKYLHDFFVCRIGDALVLDCEAARRDDLFTRLRRYKLRSKVELRLDDDHVVAAALGDGALDALGLTGEPGHARPVAGGILFTDPRLANAGARAIVKSDAVDGIFRDAGFGAGDAMAYDAHRLALGLPDGSRDLDIDKSILLEAGFDELNGVDWDKGCYMGQELTARTYYRGLIKKRLIPVAIDGPQPPPGTPVMLGDKEAGTMRSASNGRGLALMRLERLDDAKRSGTTLTAGDATITPSKPDWASF